MHTTMIRTFFLGAMLFFSILAFSTEVEEDFIITHNACFHFKKVRHGIGPGSYLVGIKDNGDRMRFSQDEVIKYKMNGYIYEKAPVVYNNIKSGDYDFMKIVCRRDEMTLYEYNDCTMCKKKDHKRYYVFRKERFVVELCSHREAKLLAKLTSSAN
jgi:hypothetical protein